MNELIQTFNFEGSNLRIIVEDGEPWFCGPDVCRALGYSNPADAIRKHAKSKGIAKRDTPTNGGIQPLAYLNEGNLYRLVMRSKLESAERFQDWVCEEVLPTIRKTGSYNAVPRVPKTLSEALRLAADLEDQKLALAAKIKEDEPKVVFAETIMHSKESMTIREAAKVLGVRESILLDFLRRKRWIFAKGTQPYADKVQKGYLAYRFKNIEHSDGRVDEKPYCHVLPEGLYALRGLLREANLISTTQPELF